MSAARLREAAALMRSRAEDARAGTWRTEPSALTPDTVLVVAEWENDLRRVATASGSSPEGNYINAEHIASWHPAVALLVADTLDDAAENLDLMPELGFDMRVHISIKKALAVADAYLGGQP